ncbi:MAG: hypothetical protein ACOX05_05820 [Bacillota bacterium]|jgi:epoxyqueuosine reductase
MQIVDDYYKKPVMPKEEFVEKALAIFTNLNNQLTEENAPHPDLIGTKIFDEPVFGIANPQDDLFYKIREENLLGIYFMMPDQWLPHAMSVVSYFFPYTTKIKEALDLSSNDKDLGEQKLLKRFGSQLEMMIMKEGYPALTPAADIRFCVEQSEDGQISGNWSEAHAAYIAGLNNFLAPGKTITTTGAAGHFGSLITALEIPADHRDNSNPLL